MKEASLKADLKAFHKLSFVKRVIGFSEEESARSGTRLASASRSRWFGGCCAGVRWAQVSGGRHPFSASGGGSLGADGSFPSGRVRHVPRPCAAGAVSGLRASAPAASLAGGVLGTQIRRWTASSVAC